MSVDKKELWKTQVHNKSFHIDQELQNIDKLINDLFPERFAYDKFCILDRQLRILRLEMRNLKSVISSINVENYIDD